MKDTEEQFFFEEICHLGFCHPLQSTSKKLITMAVCVYCNNTKKLILTGGGDAWQSVVVHGSKQ